MTQHDVLFDRSSPPAEEAEGSLVSVAVSLYNYAGVVEEALDSVRAQTHPRLELIVVDDCSRDGSAEVVRAWMERNADRFERTSLLRHRRNEGVSLARDTAFALAQAKAVLVLDADNILRPAAVTRLLEAMQDTHAACAYSQLIHFGDGVGVGVADVWNRQNFERDNYIDTMALIAYDAWMTVKGYRPGVDGWEDYDLWCRFVETGLTGVYVPELLCRYRVHANSMLRTEGVADRGRVEHLISSRHPWLSIKHDQ